MKQDDMEKEKKKCSGTYLEDSHPDIYPESVKEESGYYVATKKKQGEYTIEDYRKLPEDERAELIDGTIYDMAAPLSVHQLLEKSLPDRGFSVRRILLLRSCLKVQGRRTVI